MDMFYQPKLAVVGDTIPFCDNGQFHVFYLRNYRNNMDHEHHDSWVMLSTDDQLNFTEHDTRIDAATGSVVKGDGMYHMFATIFKSRPMKNVIIHATSPDLDRWTILEGEQLAADGVIYEPVHWRDPFVFWNEEERCWWMIVAARTRGQTLRQGCVGLCKSKDLFHWDICPPLYAPHSANCAFECPDYFRWGDWYYLVFSSYSDRYQTLYRKSRNPYGPWLAPETDTFDARAFYAAKTASDGQHRFLYGWNPTRIVNEHHFDPQKDYGRDTHAWDWGGHLIVHELTQQANGDLFVKPPAAVRGALTQPLPLPFQPVSGSWAVGQDVISVQTQDRYACALLGRLPDVCKVEMEVLFRVGTARLGAALEVDGAFDAGYYVSLEPGCRRVTYKTHLRAAPDTGMIFPWAVEMERPVCLEPDKWHSLLLLRQRDVLVIYVDDRIALSTRMYDLHNRSLGIFAEGGEALFRHISILG